MESACESEGLRDRVGPASSGSDYSEDSAPPTTHNTGLETAVKLSQQLLLIFRNSRFHFVLLGNSRSNLCTCVSSTRTPVPQPLEIPHDVEAVIVGCFIGHEMSSMKLVRLAADRVHQPVLVPLLALPEDETDRPDVELVAKAFQDLGAADVFVVNSAYQANACVSGFLMREGWSENAQRAENRLVQHEPRDPRSGGFLENRVVTPTWGNIHKFVRGFPQLDRNCDPQLRDGECIGDGVLGPRLGGGACGEVYLWTPNDGQTEAFKFVEKGHAPKTDMMLMICREIKLLSRLRHPFVAFLRRVIHSQRHVIIGTNFVGTMNLFRFLQCCTPLSMGSPESRSAIYAPINNAIAYCHEQGVAHRDLKPENIVVSMSSGNIANDPITLTVVDFGSACRLGTCRSDVVGTMPFIAPEVMMCAPHCPALADMWSCGVILLEIIYGIGKISKMLKLEQTQQPSRGLARYVVNFFNALHDRYARQSSSESSLPIGVRAVTLGLLTPDPENRWTAQDVEASDWYAATPLGGGTLGTDMHKENVEASPSSEDVKVESYDAEEIEG